MRPTESREFDLVLLGASGFVGQLTAQHLATAAPADLKIALAGRSSQKLAAIKAGLGVRARQWPLIATDSQDPVAMDALAARTRVIITTVGPYLRLGMPLVNACARAGTDYADLAGETLFIRQSVDSCQDTAVGTGARIVHACGFDSVPSDLGVGLTAAHAAADGQGTLSETVLHMRTIKGWVSGGTIDSLRQQIIEAMADPALRSLASDPLALTDRRGERKTAPTRRRRRRGPVERDPQTGGYQARFVMGGFNRQVVLLSDKISGRSYGPEFRYREVVDTGAGPLGAARAAVIGTGSTAVMAGMLFAPTRRLLDVVLPSPGDGPSERSRRRGRFLAEVESRTTAGARYRTRIGADMDPGYDAAAVMLGESGLSLALDGRLPDRAGILTPMTAMGELLAVRLRAHGFVITTEQLPS